MQRDRISCPSAFCEACHRKRNPLHWGRDTESPVHQRAESPGQGPGWTLQLLPRCVEMSVATRDATGNKRAGPPCAWQHRPVSGMWTPTSAWVLGALDCSVVLLRFHEISGVLASAVHEHRSSAECLLSDGLTLSTCEPFSSLCRSLLQSRAPGLVQLLQRRVTQPHQSA